jgi:signal transduction histidine kinase
MSQMNNYDDYFDKYKLELISEYLSILIFIIGFIIIMGWIFNIGTLKSFLPFFKPISPISALFFVLIGISLFLLQNKHLNTFNIRITRLFMVIIALTSSLIIIEYIFNINLGVNRMLINYPLENIKIAIMAFNTALNFLLTSIAIFMLDKQLNKGKYPAQYIILIVAIITLFVVAGYIYGASELYQLYFYTSMSFYTATLFTLTVPAVLFARPNKGLMKILTSERLGSSFARRILPLIIIIPLLSGLLAFLGERTGFYDTAYAISLMMILTIVFLAFMVWNSIKSINKVDAERQQTKEDLKSMVEALKHSNYELEQFAYITSHDLQEPLRTIASFTQLIEMRYKGRLDSDADEYIDFIVSAAVRMKEMIKGLLDYSRIDTQGGEFKPTDLEKVLNVALSNLNAAIKENNAEITHDPLPTVKVDERQFIQLFQNLISNAIKFRKKDEPPKIHIRAAKEDDKYVFSISDKGIGMEIQYTNHIFEIFKRLHTIGEYEGTGIGLAIVKRIIDRHGGHIWFESEPGVGSTFYFTLQKSSISARQN